MPENKTKILIVDDERPIRRFLKTTLVAHGFDVVEAFSGRDALNIASEKKPDIVILDLGLPDMDGTDVIRALREWTKIPIIILSVRDQENDKIVAFDSGADDYLTKPFGVGELIARIRVALRHSITKNESPVFQIGLLKVDLEKHLVSLDDKEISLTPTEYSILAYLVRNAGKVITHRQLLREVWGKAYEDEMHILRVNISNLRRKLETDATQPYYIRTESGIGYRMRDET
jgi:two-component system, OmpR family, KDP operon response regulator KdpE